MLHQDLVLKHNELYLAGEETSDSSRERATGLYMRDTRFLNFWDLRVNGAPLEPLEVRVLGPDRAVVVAANRALAADGQRITEPVLPLTVAVEQHVELGADLRVRIVLSNYSGRVLRLSLSLEIGGDFRDLFDIRGFPHRERGGKLRLTHAIARWTCSRLRRPFRRHDQSPGQFQPLTIAHGRLGSDGRD